MRAYIRKNIFIFFWSLAVVDILSVTFEIHALHITIKPWLMPVLIIAVLTHSANSRQRMGIVSALVFSFLGDVFLLGESIHPLFFIAGLGSFLMTHIFYIGYFLSLNKNGISKLFGKPLVLVLVILYTIALMVMLYPKLGGLTIPVLAYATVLSSMLVCSWMVYAPGKSGAGKLLVAGALCFVLSDSLLALNKFFTPLPLAGFLIMLSYCTAQYLIVKGFIKNHA